MAQWQDKPLGRLRIHLDEWANQIRDCFLTLGYTKAILVGTEPKLE